MAPRKSSAKKSLEAQKPAPEVIELSSDSEPEAAAESQTKENDVSAANNLNDANTPDLYDQPLLRAPGIRYRVDKIQETTPDAKLAVRAKDTSSAEHRHVSIEIPIPSSSTKAKGKRNDAPEDEHEAEIFKTPMERRHITFDESDHDEFVTPSEPPKKNPLETSVPSQSNPRVDEVQDSEGEEEEEDDSDDEAPEAVSTRDAAVQTKAKANKAAEAIAKAAEKEAAALKRKRQERDAIFKQQAKERKQAQEERKKPEGDDAEELAPEPVEKRKRQVPKLLPLELLESDDEDENDLEGAGSAGNGLSKRRKLNGSEQRLLREPRAPRDKQVGSTVYRVVANRGDEKQAPKAKKQTLNLKETLLRRDRQPQVKTGFFVKKR